MSRPLRILQVTDLYEPFIGGMEQHVKSLSRGLADRGRKVVVATTRLPGTADDWTIEGVRVGESLAGPAESWLTGTNGLMSRSTRRYRTLAQLPG